MRCLAQATAITSAGRSQIAGCASISAQASLDVVHKPALLLSGRPLPLSACCLPAALLARAGELAELAGSPQAVQAAQEGCARCSRPACTALWGIESAQTRAQASLDAMHTRLPGASTAGDVLPVCRVHSCRGGKLMWCNLLLQGYCDTGLAPGPAQPGALAGLKRSTHLAVCSGVRAAGPEGDGALAAKPAVPAHSRGARAPA